LLVTAKPIGLVAAMMSNGLLCCWQRWELISPLPRRDNPDREMLLAVFSFSPILMLNGAWAIFWMTDLNGMARY